MSVMKPKFKYPANPVILQSAKHQHKIQRLIDQQDLVEQKYQDKIKKLYINFQAKNALKG